MSRAAYRAWSGLLVAAGMLAAWHKNAESDIYFHLDLGRAVLRHGARVVPEPTAFVGFDPTCVVPVWLWDIAMYGLYRLGGFPALGLATVLTAALSAWVIAQLCSRAVGPDRFAAFAVVATIAVASTAGRYQMRPQTLAAVLLPFFLWLLLGYVEATGARRVRHGFLLVALSLLWAQLHNSFVLAPLVFLALVSPSLPRASAEQRRVDGLVLAGCLLSLLTSAHGLDVLHYTLAHGGGDVVRHVAEMQQPTLADVPDLVSIEGRAFALLCLLGLAGVVRDGRLRAAELASALLGLLLYSRAIRFQVEASILTIPLAAQGACTLYALVRARLSGLVRVLLTFVLLALLGSQLASRALSGSRPDGSPFGLGIDDDSVPKLASRYLRRLPAGSNVFTSHSAGSYLGFLAQGHVRTYVDGRTPMYFHEADYGVYRDALADPVALELVWQRWNIRAMVIDRDHGACDAIAQRWVPAVIEGRYSTFVPPGTSEPLLGVDPCGPAPLRKEDCPDGGLHLGATIARLAQLGDAPILPFLRAGKELLCGGSVDKAQRELDAAFPMTHRAPHERLRVRALLRQGRTEEAYARIERALQDGNLDLLSVLGTEDARGLGPARLRTLLALGVWQLDDAAKPGLRATLALLCMEQGDAECVRVQALRAAARGDPRSLPALYWLTQHHPSERVRADVEAWGRLLVSRGAAGE